MNTHFKQAATQGFCISGIAQRDIAQASVDLSHRTPVSQTAHPATEGSALDNLDHMLYVIFGSQAVNHLGYTV